MKTVLWHEYKYKKHIADNLQQMINNRYVEISDEEYARINNAIQSYSESIEEIYDNLQDVSFTEPQKSKLLEDLEKLEADILALKQSTLYTQEDGLYFTDENGNIAAKLDSTGFQAINISGGTGSSEPSDEGSSTGNSDITIIDY